MLLCLSIYSIVGMLGYTRFGDETKGDILTNYDFKSSPILIKGTFITMGVPSPNSLIQYSSVLLVTSNRHGYFTFHMLWYGMAWHGMA